MPTPPRSAELLRSTVELFEEHGTITAAAQAIGVNRTTFRDRLREAQARGYHQSEGVREAGQAAGLKPNEHHSGWRKIYDEEGKHRESVYYKAQQAPPEEIVDRIVQALEGLPAVIATPPPLHADTSLLGLVPVADLHAGMMAWGAETGEDYSTKIATQRLIDLSGRVISAMPKCSSCIVLFNGDTIHANDQRNVTPSSQHHLDVDTRHFRTLELTIEAIATAVEHARSRHGHVIVVVKQGNHDPEAYLAILFALAERYRDEPRVTVVKDPREHWVHEWGRVLLFAHHGHRAKPQDLVLGLAAEYPEQWGRTAYRYLWTGHMHHLKQADIGGVQWEQSRAVTSRDAYAASKVYAERPELQGVVYHADEGEVDRVRVTVRRN